MIKNILKKIIPKRFHKQIQKAIGRKKHFIEGLNSDYKNLPYKALLYYKATPFTNKKFVEEYKHTNYWENIEMVRILNKFGFEVDVVDRGARNFIPKNRYHLFIGMGSGDSGKNFDKYAAVLPGATKILYATTTEPNLKNKLAIKRYQEFEDRTGIEAEPMRTVKQLNFNRSIQHTDYIFCFSEKDNFSFESYKKFNKPIMEIAPPVSPAIRFNPTWLKTRNRNHFLCLAGHGSIYKGIDLLVEAFKQMPDKKLTICGPENETAFFDVYGPIIKKSQNIHYEGFIHIGGERFEQLGAECSFIINHSASEGVCTSVASGMRAGLIPIVNPESGNSTNDFGFLMEDKADYIADIINTVQKASKLSNDDYIKRVYKTLEYATNYSQAAFTSTFAKALLQVMQRENKFYG